MACIIFRDRDGAEAFLSGFERTRANFLCGDLFVAAIGSDIDLERGDHWIRRLIRPDHYTLRQSGEMFGRALALSCSARVGQTVFQIRGSAVTGFALALNTAIVGGSDPVRLLARLHGQCEIWAWVDGPNRAWLAGIVEEGLGTGVLPGGPVGWEALAETLRSSDDSPIVSSYSVSDDFPTGALIDGDKDDAWWDAWYDATFEERWDRCVAVLRAESAGDPATSVEMRPDHWASYRFEPVEINGFNLRGVAERLEDEEDPR